MIDRLDAFQQAHPVLGFPIAVLYKYFDDQGGYLAALVAYYGLLSLFPLLLLLTTVLGIVLESNPELQREVLDSALGQFPGVGEDLAQPGQVGGGTLGLVIGILGSLYGGLGVAQAVQHLMNTAWAVPKNERPNPFKARALSLGLLGTIALAVLATTALTAVVSGAGGIADDLGLLFQIGVLAATIALNTIVFAFAFRLATARPLSLRDVLPGAVVAAVAWAVLQAFGASYVGRVSESESTTNGAFGVVLGLIAFLYLASTIIVIAAEVNVVRLRRLYPRTLLTPFTDAVELTPGDKRAYTGMAEAQRSKGFQGVDVTFGPSPKQHDDPGPAKGT